MQEESEFYSLQRQKIVLCYQSLVTALWSVQPSVFVVTCVFFLGVDWLESNVGHSYLSSVEINDMQSLTSTPQYLFLSECIIKHGNSMNSLPHCDCLCLRGTKCVHYYDVVFIGKGKSEAMPNEAPRRKQAFRKRCTISNRLNLDIDGVDNQVQALADLLAVLIG